MDKKNNYLNLCFRSIYLTYIECYLFGQIYESLNIPETAPCSANFRDTFFHFRKLYESDFNEEYLAQYESTVEHANRLFKDSIIRITQVLVFSLTNIMKLVDEKSIYMDLFDHKVKLKRIQLDLRSKALEIQRPLDGTEAANEPINIINDIIKDLKSKNLYEDLLNFNSKYY